MTDDMAQFEDRWTVRYVRLLSASVPRVWDAVTQSEQLNIWFVPVAKVDPKLGGRCSFSWGRAESENELGTVTKFEPKKLFQISMEADPEQYLRFELEPVDANTRFTFTNRFSRRMLPEDLELADANPDNKLLALPAGRDTPIRAGILEGYHLMLDAFGAFLTHDWASGELEKISAGIAARSNSQQRARFEGADAAPSALALAYYDHIRDHCPPC